MLYNIYKIIINNTLYIKTEGIVINFLKIKFIALNIFGIKKYQEIENKKY